MLAGVVRRLFINAIRKQSITENFAGEDLRVVRVGRHVVKNLLVDLEILA